MFRRVLFVCCVVSLVSLGCWPNTDTDEDGVLDNVDNCIEVPNPGQEDGDSDQVGDVCDNCIDVHNPGQEDSDENGIGDACQIDDCDGLGGDTDEDGICDDNDNCPNVENPEQEDSDCDSIGDDCDDDNDTTDADCDGIIDGCDSDVDLTDSDCDGIVDGCDDDVDTTDDDCDGVVDSCDDDVDLTDADCDGIADGCDDNVDTTDDDCDGIVDGCDDYIDPNGCGCNMTDDADLTCRYASTFSDYNCVDFPGSEGWASDTEVDTFCTNLSGAQADTVVVSIGDSCRVENIEDASMNRCRANDSGKKWYAYMPDSTPGFVCGLLPGSEGLETDGPFCDPY